MIRQHLVATVKGFPVYAHTIDHPAGLVLVDTGMIDSTPELDEEWDPVPMPENIPRDVVCVINTHLDFDHCGDNRLFPGVPIHVQRHELDNPREPTRLGALPRRSLRRSRGRLALGARTWLAHAARHFPRLTS